MAFSQNQFGALLEGEDNAEVDKLGNIKPSDNDDRPVARPRRTHQPAMSPPSRRARGDQESFETLHKEQHKPDDIERKGRDARRHGAEPAYRGRQYDRRSGEVNPFGTKKKNDQSWGHLEESQVDAATDGLAPNDPDAADGTGDLRAKQQEEEENVMTLDEYMKNRSSPKQSLPPPREANDGKEDPKWKDGVVVHRPDDDDYYSGKDASNKSRTRTRKEKVFIDIDPPRHQPQASRGRGFGRGGGGDRGGRGGRGRGNGRGGARGGRGGRNQNVNLSDANAFPTLG
ncbi:unnamed protein product [Absidia cylindrospora]